MDRRGVTLLELLAVLFIMALIAGLSTVTFGNFNKNLRYDVAARNVSSALKLAKSYAVSTGNEHSFNVEDDAINAPEKALFKEYWIVNKNTSLTVDGTKYRLSDGVMFQDPTPSEIKSEIIVFTPPAGSPASGRDIYLVDKDGNTKKTIKVEGATARISIE